MSLGFFMTTINMNTTLADFNGEQHAGAEKHAIYVHF